MPPSHVPLGVEEEKRKKEKEESKEGIQVKKRKKWK